MNEKLTLILRKIIREEIRTELQIFKGEMLREISSNLGNRITEMPVKPSNTPIQSTQKRHESKREKPKPKFSNDPFLQSLLENTDPLYTDEPEIFPGDFVHTGGDDLSFLVEEPSKNNFKFDPPQQQPSQVRNQRRPLVESDIDGRPINPQNETVANVLDILANTDFKAKLKAMESSAKEIRKGFGDGG